jgi:hypothetical protein
MNNSTDKTQRNANELVPKEIKTAKNASDIAVHRGNTIQHPLLN